MIAGQAGEGADPTRVIIDTTSLKAHSANYSLGANKACAVAKSAEQVGPKGNGDCLGDSSACKLNTMPQADTDAKGQQIRHFIAAEWDSDDTAAPTP
ncbi:hypothetical protein [Paracoccus sp. Ld10]|uniref:hypothetical protein n=1 Tax=Paracoccus sp. Ld10 TaxID=649158 RepID=UPI00386E14A4